MQHTAPGKPSPLQGRALRTPPAPARSSGAPSSRGATRSTPVLPLPFFMSVCNWYIISFFRKLHTCESFCKLPAFPTLYLYL